MDSKVRINNRFFNTLKLYWLNFADSGSHHDNCDFVSFVVDCDDYLVCAFMCTCYFYCSATLRNQLDGRGFRVIGKFHFFRTSSNSYYSTAAHQNCNFGFDHEETCISSCCNRLNIGLNLLVNVDTEGILASDDSWVCVFSKNIILSSFLSLDDELVSIVLNNSQISWQNKLQIWRFICMRGDQLTIMIIEHC